MATTKPDPAVSQIYAENIRASTVRPATPVKVDPQLVKKIRERVQIFRGMNHECLLRTLSLGDYIPLKAGQVIFKEGDLGDSFFVLAAGQVVVELTRAGNTVELARFGPAECFGEMALVSQQGRTATVRALSDSIAMRFYRETIDVNPESGFHIYRNIASILSARLKESSIQLARLSTSGKSES